MRIPLDHDVLARLGEVAVQHMPGRYGLVLSG
jgi:hypothetical protein